MKKTEWLVPGSFILLATILRLWLFSGLHGHDDWAYLFYIRSFLNGQTDELLHSLWGLRFPIWLPIAGLFKAFGVSYPTAFLPGFLLGLASVPLVYLSLRRLHFPVWVGGLGCLLLVLNPIDWMVSTTIRGDIEMSFSGGALIFLLIQFRQETGRRQRARGLAAGIVLGLSAVTKEWGYVFAWGVVALAVADIIEQRRLPWAFLSIGLGFLSVLITDGILLYMLTGDWLARLHTSLTWYQRAANDGGYIDDLSTSYRYLPELFLGLRNKITEYGRFGNGYPYFGPYMWLLLLALPLRLLKKGPACTASWFIAGILLWVEFGSMSWQQYLPYHKEPRYFALLSAPIAVMVASVGGWIAQGGLRSLKVAAITALGAISVLTARAVWLDHGYYVAGRECLPALVAWLRAHPGERLWTTATIQNELDLRFSYRFADPVHDHVGSDGYGAILDLGFWDRHQDGDYVLVPIGWPAFSPAFPEIKRETLSFIAHLDPAGSTASLYRVGVSTGPGQAHYLSDDEPTSVRQTFERPWRDRAFDGSPIFLNGIHYNKGIGTHAEAEIEFHIGGQYRVFTSEVGLADSADGSEGSVRFSVYVDGELKGQSPVMHWNTPTYQFEVDIVGAATLKLIAEDAGDGITCDHAIWANAFVSAQGGPAHQSTDNPSWSNTNLLAH